jgi:hypothetical protein
MSDWASLGTMTRNSSAYPFPVFNGESKLFAHSVNWLIRFAMMVRSAVCTQGAGRRSVRYLGGMLLAGATFIALACATTHATLSFMAPSSVTAGKPFTVTVNVLYKGKPDTIINNRIQFTSSDPAAILPPDYYFTPADAGSHTFTNGFTLSTPGNQTISGSIHDSTGINGSAMIAVSP